MKILFDTNSIIYCLEKKVDLINYFQERNYDILLFDIILNELKKVDSKKHKLFLDIINNKNIKIIKTQDGHPDEILTNYAKKNNCAILTNDKILKKNLNLLNIETFTVSNKTIKKI